jgi:hypothetical protein
MGVDLAADGDSSVESVDLYVTLHQKKWRHPWAGVAL